MIQKNKSGFTIVEMLIYGALLSLFIVVLSSMFSAILETQLGSESTSAVVQDGRYLLSRFSYDVGRASVISVPLAVGGQSNSLELIIDGTTRSYAINSGVLEITDLTGTNRLNSFGTTVSGLSFQRFGTTDGKNSVRINFTLTSTTERSSGPEIRDFQSAYSLR